MPPKKAAKKAAPVKGKSPVLGSSDQLSHLATVSKKESPAAKAKAPAETKTAPAKAKAAAEEVQAPAPTTVAVT